MMRCRTETLGCAIERGQINTKTKKRMKKLREQLLVINFLLEIIAQ